MVAEPFEVLVRKAGFDDLDTIASIDRSLFPPGIYYNTEAFFFYLLDPASICLVAEASGEVAGFVLMTAHTKTEGCLVTIDVSRKWQGRGIGSRLMGEIESAAAEIGVKRMVLQVSVNNERAIGFYEKRGYKKTGVLKNYYQDSSDAWEMKRDF